MKVLTIEPVVFTTGDVLAPEDLDAVYLYCKDAVADVAQKRWAKGVLLLPFVEAVDTTYTQASSAEERTYRFVCPVTCVVERAFLNANLTSSAEVQVNISPLPTGCTSPWLTTGGAIADATVDTTDINVDRFVLNAGTEYQIVVSTTGANTFTLNRFDVVLHVACDRWTTSGTPSVPSFDPTLLTDASKLDATTINANDSALSTAAALFASSKAAPTPTMIVKHGFLSGADANLLKYSIPTFSSARAQAKLKRAYLFVSMASTLGGTVTATIKDQAGATQATLTANVAGVTQKSVDSGALSLALDAGASDNASSDWSVTFANSSGTVNCVKAYVLLWIARA